MYCTKVRMYGTILNGLRQHHTRDDNQVEEFREPEEECEASDKDDWQIEMPDGDEIDDIEEACVFEDSPPPKNRQRLSC
jgi:hypothetical protein